MTPPDEIRNLADDYLDGTIDPDGLGRLEEWLTAGPDGRAWFVRYCRLHTDLHFEAKARRAGEIALDRLPPPRPGRKGWPPLWVGAMAASLLIAVGLASRFGPKPGLTNPEGVAWLVNAQDCRWAEGGAPRGAIQPGDRVRIEAGLAEFRFATGIELLLQGPAEVEWLAADAVRLEHGRITARVTDPAARFTVASRHGTIMDLGTEFGVAVGEDGSAEVFVFDGEVLAGDGSSEIRLRENEAARIDDSGVRGSRSGGNDFRRRIEPRPGVVARSLELNFRRAVSDSLADAEGRGTGLTHRLPGTGGALPDPDPNLRLVPERGRLELTTTDSDLNHQHRLETGEYFGFLLGRLGFTGSEDFEISADVSDIPALQKVGQFGLYAGIRSDSNLRGGLISLDPEHDPANAGRYTLFLVQNRDGIDVRPSQYVGLVSTGDTLRMTLKRAAGRYSYTVENITDATSYTLAFPEPEYLAGEPDLYVGLFGANTQSPVRKTLSISRVAATVWVRDQ